MLVFTLMIEQLIFPLATSRNFFYILNFIYLTYQHFNHSIFSYKSTSSLQYSIIFNFQMINNLSPIIILLVVIVDSYDL